MTLIHNSTETGVFGCNHWTKTVSSVYATIELQTLVCCWCVWRSVFGDYVYWTCAADHPRVCLYTYIWCTPHVDDDVHAKQTTAMWIIFKANTDVSELVSLVRRQLINFFCSSKFLIRSRLNTSHGNKNRLAKCFANDTDVKRQFIYLFLFSNFFFYVNRIKYFYRRI